MKFFPNCALRVTVPTDVSLKREQYGQISVGNNTKCDRVNAKLCHSLPHP